MVSGNPVLKGITEYLVEEASAEEEELLGQGVVTEDSKARHTAALKVNELLLIFFFYYIFSILIDTKFKLF